MVTIFRSATVGIALSVATLAPPALAHPATARLIACDTGSCLLVRGRRAASATEVRINDRVVAVEGGRSWRVSLPMTTVKEWSGPFARALRVSMSDPSGSVTRTEAVRLPVGLLGHDVELAYLVVHAR
jgi:hypothetical protein